MNDAEYRVFVQNVRKMANIEAILKPAAGLSSERRFGYNFVIGEQNRGWVLDRDETSFLLYLDQREDASAQEVRRPVAEAGGATLRTRARTIVDALAEKLDARLREWKPETAAVARERIAQVIELADHDALDIARSRAVEQDVLDLLDEPATR